MAQPETSDCYSTHKQESHHTHVSSHAVAKNSRRLWFVLILTGSILFAEIFGAILTGSLSLLADAGHVTIDLAAIALSLFATWIAQKPPTLSKTYGYYRTEILVALFNGAALLGVTFYIFYEAWERFQNPTVIQGSLMTGFAIAGLVANVISMLLTHNFGTESLNLRAVKLHILNDTLGSVSTVVAGILIWKYNWYLADPIISVLLAVFILSGAVKLLLECVNVLMEGTPKHIDIQTVKKEICSFSEVTGIHDLHVWTLTNGLVALSAHVLIKENSNQSKLLRSLVELIHENHPISHVTLQLEPPSFSHES